MLLKRPPIVIVHHFYAEDPVGDRANEHVLRLVKLLNDCPLVEVILDLVLSGNSFFEHWVHEILGQLPKCEEIVARGYHVINAHVFWGVFFVETLHSSLELLCDDLINVQHF